jgi:hypothetical protein
LEEFMARSSNKAVQNFKIFLCSAADLFLSRWTSSRMMTLRGSTGSSLIQHRDIVIFIAA